MEADRETYRWIVLQPQSACETRFCCHPVVAAACHLILSCGLFINQEAIQFHRFPCLCGCIQTQSDREILPNCCCHRSTQDYWNSFHTTGLSSRPRPFNWWISEQISPSFSLPQSVCCWPSVNPRIYCRIIHQIGRIWCTRGRIAITALAPPSGLFLESTGGDCQGNRDSKLER